MLWGLSCCRSGPATPMGWRGTAERSLSAWPYFALKFAWRGAQMLHPDGGGCTALQVRLLHRTAGGGAVSI
jgi:hypothetical protein